MGLCRFIYGVIEKYLCNECVVHVHYVAIDDLVITTPLKNDIAALWSCSGKAGASLLGQDVVASLLSFCMAKWLRKWRRGWLYAHSNTKNAKSLLWPPIRYPITLLLHLYLHRGNSTAPWKYLFCYHIYSTYTATLLKYLRGYSKVTMKLLQWSSTTTFM